MNNKISSIFSTILLGLGIIFLVSPLLLYWWIHGNYDRYLWIINGPMPYSNFGSGSYQLFLFGALFLMGIGLIAAALVAKKRLRDKEIITNK